jgi:hypothetical protein
MLVASAGLCAQGGTLVVNVNSPSDIPVLAEPWFLAGVKHSRQFRAGNGVR